MEYVDQAVAILREGFANTNNPKGLLIALAATLFMGSWKQWIPVALVATIIHVAIDRLAPVLAGDEGAAVTLPPIMEPAFWTNTGVLLAGYAIIIGVFYLIKSMIFRRSAAH
jgi:hypothetical protein